MKVKKYLEKLIEQDRDLYGKRYERNGVIYKEVSERFPNGKKFFVKLKSS